MTLIEHLREIAKKDERNQITLAMDANMTACHMSSIILGKANPSLRKIEDLAEALGYRVVLERVSPINTEHHTLA